MCVEDSEMYVMGDPFAYSRQSIIVISYKACREDEHVKEGEEGETYCESLEDQSEIYLDFRIMIEHQQVLMKNKTHPMQVFRQLIDSSYKYTVIELAHNQFIDNSDRIGITFEDPED